MKQSSERLPFLGSRANSAWRLAPRTSPSTATKRSSFMRAKSSPSAMEGKRVGSLKKLPNFALFLSGRALNHVITSSWLQSSSGRASSGYEERKGSLYVPWAAGGATLGGPESGLVGSKALTVTLVGGLLAKAMRCRQGEALLPGVSKDVSTAH